MSDISILKAFHFHMALEHTYTQLTGTCAHACLTPNMRISTKEKTAWNFIEKKIIETEQLILNVGRKGYFENQLCVIVSPSTFTKEFSL